MNRLGFPGVAGAGLLAFCAMFYFSAVLPASREARPLKLEAEQARARVHSGGLSEQGPASQLGAFYKSFPKEKGWPDVMGRLYDAASAQGVTLEQGEYHLVRNASEKLVRYEVSLPAKGEYLRIRRFISHVLTAAPYVSLDSVAFQRQKISDTMVEAQIKMTLHLIRD